MKTQDSMIQFLSKCRGFESNSPNYKFFLVGKYRSLFEEDIPDNIPLALVKYKIAYKLEVLHCQVQKKPISPVLKTNYNAAMNFNRNGFVGSIRDILDSELRKKSFTTSSDQTEKIESHPAPQKGSKIKSGPTIFQLLLTNNETKFSDKAIREKVSALCGNFSSPISAYRSLLNTRNSRLPDFIKLRLEEIQLPIHEYDEEGNVIQPKKAKKK